MSSENHRQSRPSPRASPEQPDDPRLTPDIPPERPPAEDPPVRDYEDGSTAETDSETTADTIGDDLREATESIAAEANTDWECTLEWNSHNQTTNYFFSPPEGDQSFAIRQKRGGYYVHVCDTNTPDLENCDTVRECQSFSTSIATVLGVLEWETLPPGDPEIWQYEGYDDEGSFGEYLSGSNNENCGRHRFANLKANYTIRIESFATSPDTTSSSKEGTTFARLSVSDSGSEACSYQRTFSGQREAFNHLFSLIDNDLSHTIAAIDS